MVVSNLQFPLRFVTLLSASLLFCVPACSAQSGDEGNQAGSASPSSHEISLTEVEFLDGETRLAGTVYRPDLDTPVPALALLGGSDRGARGRMKDQLARAFSEGGVAVLTYDSPGTGKSGGRALFQTRQDRAREGLAAVQFLRSFDGIDPARVGICGGSEGAGIALMTAGMDPDIAFAIAISGAFGMASMDVSRFRIEAMGLRQGLSDDSIRKALVLEEILYALVTGLDVVEWRLIRRQSSGWENEPWGELIEIVEGSRQELSEADQDAMWSSLQRILRGWMTEAWFELAVPDRANLERLLGMDTQMFFGFLTRGPLAAGDWFRGLEELELLARVRCPVLGVWGEEDDFLPARRSAAWLGANLPESTETTFRILPGADHSLLRVDDPTTYVSGYPRLMADWVRQGNPEE